MLNRNLKEKNTKRYTLSRIVRMKGEFLVAFLDYWCCVFLVQINIKSPGNLIAAIQRA